MSLQPFPVIVIKIHEFFVRPCKQGMDAIETFFFVDYLFLSMSKMYVNFIRPNEVEIY